MLYTCADRINYCSDTAGEGMRVDKCAEKPSKPRVASRDTASLDIALAHPSSLRLFDLDLAWTPRRVLARLLWQASKITGQSSPRPHPSDSQTSSIPPPPSRRLQLGLALDAETDVGRGLHRRVGAWPVAYAPPRAA
eukprot:CAMPEP_0204110372 /NCGR_PEP_ID=MMETSP0361-20130328/1849_1 /ASSEMBLY_ACC=CAM_ASM_000343 /TAXON_ID=268821 /ORGANISM="Scrippsiella Hangoei, Strain SHTV-5" /LENGTH=136 /DNA_ID=CAMNT_0051060275 /DNA_START=117 /DNA_END=525 /DNA_ORIENTATION=+